MKRWRSLVLIFALAGGFVAGLAYLFGAEFAVGDVYPEYSSLRADPMGAKLLYESLAQLPGLHVSRHFLPLDLLPKQAATVILLADNPLAGGLPSIEKIAGGGNRVVVALQDEPNYNATERREFHRWGITFEASDPGEKARPWSIAEAPGWKEIERVDGKLVSVEKDFGQGSVAFFTRSSGFSNTSLVLGGEEPVITAALGGNARVVFDESHLGIAESGSIVGLVRRFQLTGFAAGLAICAAFFVWRNASSFPPPARSISHARRVTRTSVSGLQTLLHKNIPAGGLTAACWREWIASNRAAFSDEKLARAETITRSLANQPVEAARQIHAVLYPTAEQAAVAHSKGQL